MIGLDSCTHARAHWWPNSRRFQSSRAPMRGKLDFPVQRPHTTAGHPDKTIGVNDGQNGDATQDLRGHGCVKIQRNDRAARRPDV